MTDAERAAAFGAYRSLFISAPDGLRLHVRDYGSRGGSALPVVCLPGLARTSADFHALAAALASDPALPRRVVALDYRGRGHSEYDRNPDNYSLPVELADVRSALAALECAPAIFIGTSRGGILTMLLAAAQPNAIAGAVLNDIGPVVEAKGLLRIKGYVGKLPQPRTIEEGADILRNVFRAQFPKLDAEGWRAAAELTWRIEESGPVLNYDPQLARTLETVALEHTPPPLWPQFDALAAVPLLVIRGALSDLLSPATVKAMRARRRKKMEFIEVSDEGHPPSLASEAVIRRIATFCRNCDRAAGLPSGSRRGQNQ